MKTRQKISGFVVYYDMKNKAIKVDSKKVRNDPDLTVWLKLRKAIELYSRIAPSAGPPATSHKGYYVKLQRWLYQWLHWFARWVFGAKRPVFQAL